MVSCDLCGASPSGTEADADADAGASPSGTDVDADLDASASGTDADAGASPSGTDADADLDASASGTDAEAGAHAPVQRRHQAPARADAADADATVPLSWVISVEAGRTRTYCETCAREHLRSIEAKLDSAWW